MSRLPTPMMKCGHAANAIDAATGKPCCVICAGLGLGADEIADEQPDLSGRMSLCTCCKKTTPSRLDLPFFEYRPERETDLHYDMCRGCD